MGCASSVPQHETNVSTPGPRPHRSPGDGRSNTTDHPVFHDHTKPSPSTTAQEEHHDQNKSSLDRDTYTNKHTHQHTDADDSLEADNKGKQSEEELSFSGERGMEADIPERESPEGVVTTEPSEVNKGNISAESQHNKQEECVTDGLYEEHSNKPNQTSEDESSGIQDELDGNTVNHTGRDHPANGRCETDQDNLPSTSTAGMESISKRNTSPSLVPVGQITEMSRNEKTPKDSGAKSSKKRTKRTLTRSDAGPLDREALKEGLLCGDYRVRCPRSVKIVRVFLSSTFTDTKQERNELLKRSYPFLKEVCKARGYEFQLVDMRWGVGQAIANEHMTSDMCFKEIQLCQKLSTGPNFVTLLSHKYGYYAYPRQIEAELFEKFLNVLETEEDRQFLNKRWFVLDENAQPPHYTLKPISTHYPDFMSSDFKTYNKTRKECGAKDLDRLVEILVKAAMSVFGEEEGGDFVKGVTEREIELGILRNPRRDETCLWLRRNIDDIGDELENKSRFADTEGDSAWDKRNKKLLGELRDSLKATLPESNLEEFNWCLGWSQKDTKLHHQYIDRLCTEFETRVEHMFTKAADDLESQELGDSLLDELVHHTVLAQAKCKDFSGREEMMKQIKQYLLDTDNNKPLVIYGSSGSGKSTVIAMTMRETWEWREGKVAIVTRFIGATPESSRVGTVLASMTRQIQRIYRPHSTKSNQNTEFKSFSQICEEFSNSLKMATKERPLVVLIDSFEQLDPLEEAMNLTWIPHPRLPDNVKVVISSLKQEELINELKPLKHELKGFSPEDAMATLNQWLSQESRTLTDVQFEEVRAAFTQCSIPLYIRLVLQETLRWKSFSPVDETRLKGTVQEAISAFFERTEQNHGKIFTSHTLGYLTLARRGLSESEMEDILSCDDDVLNEILAFWVPPIRRLPPLILVRLRNDLDLYIAQREIDRVPVLLWNHQLFKDVAQDMYCADTTNNRLLHSNLADFFSGTWSGCKKDFKDGNGQTGSEDRQVAAQPVKHGNVANLRKLSNLPWHLAHLDSSDRLKQECLFNMDFLTVKITSFGIRSVIDDFTDAVKCFPEEQKMFRKIKEAIQISQKAILHDINQLPAQLMNRLKKSNHGDLRKLLHNCKQVEFPILVCDQQILMPPGGSLQHSLPSHQGRVLSLDLTDDGNTAVTCGEDRRIMVWDVTAGLMLFSFDTGDEEPIKAFLAYNDLSIVVVTNQSLSTYGKDTGKLFKKITFQDLHLTDVPAVCTAGKSKDKETRITKANVVLVTNSQINVFAARKLGGPKTKEIPELVEGTIGKRSLCVGHQDHIAVTDEDRYYLRVIRLKPFQDIATRRIYPAFDVSTGDNHFGPTIDGLCFSGKGDFLFVSNWKEGDILCLDCEDLKETSRLQGVDEDKPTNFRVTKEEGTLYFPSENRVVIRDHIAQERTCVAEHPCHVTFCATADFNPLVTAGDDGIIRLWSYSAAKLAWPEREKSNTEADNMIRTLCLFRKNPRYALALKVATDRSRQVLVQDLLEGKVMRRANIKCNLEMEIYEEEPVNVTAIIRLPSGKLSILDLDQMKVTDRLELSTPEPRSPEKRSFSILRKRQEILAIGSKKDSIKIFDLRTNSIKDDVQCENQDVENFQVNDRESVLAIATEDCSCIIYNLETSQRVSLLTPVNFIPDDADKCYFLKVTCVTSDGKYIVLETDSLLKVWNTSMGGKLSNDLDIYINTEEYPEIQDATCVSGNQLLTAAEDGTTRLFDIRTGEMQKEHLFHRKEVRLSTGPSDTYMTYGEDAQDQTIAVWSLNKKDPIAAFTSDQMLDQVTFSQNGKFVVGCLRNPAQIVTWHVQDGTISRDKSMDGQQLFQNEKLDIDLNLHEEDPDNYRVSTDDDLDSPEENAEDLENTY